MTVLLLLANVLLLRAECAVIHVVCIAQYHEYPMICRIKLTRIVLISFMYILFHFEPYKYIFIIKFQIEHH